MPAQVGHFRCFHEKDLPGLTWINRKLCKSDLNLAILEKPFWYILGSVRFLRKLGERDFGRRRRDGQLVWQFWRPNWSTSSLVFNIVIISFTFHETVLRKIRHLWTHPVWFVQKIHDRNKKNLKYCMHMWKSCHKCVQVRGLNVKGCFYLEFHSYWLYESIWTETWL